MQHIDVSKMTNEELWILAGKIQLELRERRIKAIFKKQSSISNPRVKQMYFQLEKQLNKTFPIAYILDELLEQLEYMLELEVDV